uniref:Deltameth_res domain-containing protein n=1 Tax=Steinernema glaseri TaxID=37863 RepID=A0A1I7Z5A1_9BILA
MKAFAAASRLAQSAIKRRAVNQVSKRADHHGGHITNPGPPVTLDLMPVPKFKYQTVYNELQGKFNMMLAASATFFVGCVAVALYSDIFAVEAIRAPESYRNRK